MNIDDEYTELVDNLGENNLQFEYFNGDDSEMEGLSPAEMIKRIYSKVKLTYLPSGAIFLGTKSDTQIENVVNAMADLEKSLSK